MVPAGAVRALVNSRSTGGTNGSTTREVAAATDRVTWFLRRRRNPNMARISSGRRATVIRRDAAVGSRNMSGSEGWRT
jgi:hypothetical protein